MSSISTFAASFCAWGGILGSERLESHELERLRVSHLLESDSFALMDAVC